MTVILFLLDCFEALLQICQNVVDMLDTDRQTNGGRCDAGCQQFFLSHLRMGRRCRMDHQRFHVCDVCQQREDLQGFCELLCLLLGAVQFESEDRCTAVRIVLVVQFQILAGCLRRVG